jgi:hypothetical protein
MFFRSANKITFRLRRNGDICPDQEGAQAMEKDDGESKLDRPDRGDAACTSK